MEAIWGLIQVLLLMAGAAYVLDISSKLKLHEKGHQDSLNKIEKLEFYLKRRDERIDELKQHYSKGCKRPHVIFKTFENKTYSIPIKISKKDNLKSIIPRLIVSKNLYDYMGTNHKLDIGIFHSIFNDLNYGDTLKWFHPFGCYRKNSEGDYVVYEAPIKYDREIQLYCHDEYDNIDYSQFNCITVSRPRIITITDLSKVSKLYFHAKELIHGSERCSFKTSLNNSYNYYEKFLEINPYFVCYEYSLFNQNILPTFDPSELVAF